MHYVSTRGGSAPQDFRETVMAGLAPDGGLFLPERLPDVSAQLKLWQDLPFGELFQQVVAPFVGETLSAQALRRITARSFAAFDHAEVTPVVPVGELYVCELFHGPTLAFKDVALQFLGNLFEHFLAEEAGHLTVLGATSGDTGSAAIHALRGRRGVDVFILYPQGRVSPVQERQMTTVADPNVHAVAVQGSFDDAQALVKALFGDRAFNERCRLGAVNSINWARVMAQITYFFYAYFRVLEQSAARGGPRLEAGDPVRVAVPTGNFGHIYAGVLARRMGLPLERLILATNENAILYEWVQTGRYRKSAVRQTWSPSMDIQAASNFERYLFDLAGRDGAQVQAWMDELRESGEIRLSPEYQPAVRAELSALSVSNEETLQTIREVHEANGYLLDPHTAVAWRAAEHHGRVGMPTLVMGTAHPGKFGGAIERALGEPMPLPEALGRLEHLPTREQVLPADVDALKAHIEAALAARAPTALDA